VETSGQNILDRGMLSAGNQGEVATHASLMYFNNKAIYSLTCYIAQAGIHLFCKYPKLWCV